MSQVDAQTKQYIFHYSWSVQNYLEWQIKLG